MYEQIPDRHDIHSEHINSDGPLQRPAKVNTFREAISAHISVHPLLDRNGCSGFEFVELNLEMFGNVSVSMQGLHLYNKIS